MMNNMPIGMLWYVSLTNEMSKAFCSLRSEPAVMPHIITPPWGQKPKQRKVWSLDFLGLFSKRYPSTVWYSTGTLEVGLPWVHLQIDILQLSRIVQGLWRLDFLGLFANRYPSTVSYSSTGTLEVGLPGCMQKQILELSRTLQVYSNAKDCERRILQCFK